MFRKTLNVLLYMLWCIILSVNNTYMDAGGYAHD